MERPPTVAQLMSSDKILEDDVSVPAGGQRDLALEQYDQFEPDSILM
jgi:hypothetical protein